VSKLDFDLPGRLLTVMRPDSLAERVGLRITGGRTAVQLLERLRANEQTQLRADSDNENLAHRQALSKIQGALDQLERSGQARRSQAKIRTDLRGKGVRLVLVDVYRCAT
jgi:hypothetical protein